ncbi:ATP-binding cassette domain-containing protein, partial [Pseudomonas aeruginosa]|uniref:ATP-binding cassette domain-containing protein n=1 Tax=Pseudomonas aeruginosa TaxID=287 RepID=UPI0028FDA5BB
MMDATELLLDVRNLSVRFDNPAKPPALSDVSFTLGKGEILGIVGETGAGKSLLARAIIDMLPAEARITEGEVLVNGQSISRMTDEQKRGFRGGEVALIGTNAKALLDPVVTVGEQIARVLRAHRGIGKAEAWNESIRLFELLWSTKTGHWFRFIRPVIRLPLAFCIRCNCVAADGC